MKQQGYLESIVCSVDFDSCICTGKFNSDLDKPEHFGSTVLYSRSCLNITKRVADLQGMDLMYSLGH